MMSVPTNQQIIDRTPAMRAYFNEMEQKRRYYEQHPEAGESREGQLARHYREAIFVAAQYQHMGLEMEDLLGYANIGLVLAIDSYDSRRGMSLSSYAMARIHQEVCRGLTETGHPVRLPIRMRLLAKKIFREQQAFFAREGRQATTDELAERLGKAAQLIEDVLAACTQMQSIDSPMLGSEEESSTVGEQLADEDAVDNDVLMQVERLLERLPAREREVVVRHFYNGEEDGIIARQMHLSRVRVLQILRGVCPMLKRK